MDFMGSLATYHRKGQSLFCTSKRFLPPRLDSILSTMTYLSSMHQPLSHVATSVHEKVALVFRIMSEHSWSLASITPDQISHALRMPRCKDNVKNNVKNRNMSSLAGYFLQTMMLFSK
jgi:hypothetical protein